MRRALFAAALAIALPAAAEPSWLLIAIEKWEKPMIHEQFAKLSMYGVGFFVDPKSMHRSGNFVYYNASWVPINESNAPVITLRPKSLVTNCKSGSFKFVAKEQWSKATDSIPMQKVNDFVCGRE